MYEGLKNDDELQNLMNEKKIKISKLNDNFSAIKLVNINLVTLFFGQKRKKKNWNWFNGSRKWKEEFCYYQWKNYAPTKNCLATNKECKLFVFLFLFSHLSLALCSVYLYANASERAWWRRNEYGGTQEATQLNWHAWVTSNNKHIANIMYASARNEERNFMHCL